MLRTVRLIGGAYSLDNNLSATIKINNNVVYSGLLQNVEKTAVPESGLSKTDIIASWDYDFGFVYGQIQPDDAKIDFSIQVSGGDSFSGISLAGIHVNWFLGPQIDMINKKYYCRGPEFFYYPGRINFQTDGKSNVMIDGIDQMWQRSNDRIGIYHWPVYSGSTLTCQIDARATITPDSNYSMELDSDENFEQRMSIDFNVTEAYSYVKEIHDECKNAGSCLALDNGLSEPCPNIGQCRRSYMI